MVSDPISDLLTRVKNGYRAGLLEIVVPNSRTSLAVAQVLVAEGYLAKIEKTEGGLKLVLKYQGKSPAITDLRRISKPGRRIYSPVSKLPRVWGGLGRNILSTPKGVMSDREAKKLNVGGEILAQVW